MRPIGIHFASALGVSLLLTLAAPAAPPPSDPTKCPPYADGRKPDASPIVDAIDKNHDGKMTKEEWTAAAAPEPSWNMFMRHEKVAKQGYITREDFLSESPPNGIDANCDGKITIEEFLATKKWMMGPGGPPAGGGQAGEGGGAPPPTVRAPRSMQRD